MDLQLSGKRAVVTGNSSGIGERPTPADRRAAAGLE
jgi:short-subunit dehydrogenase